MPGTFVMISGIFIFFHSNKIHLGCNSQITNKEKIGVTKII